MLKNEFLNIKNNLETMNNQSVLVVGDFTIETNTGFFDSFISFESSGLKVSQILNYTFKEYDTNIKEEKMKFMDTLIKYLDFYFFEKHSLVENDTILISCVLNPIYKCDFIYDDEYEKVKELFDNLLGNILPTDEITNNNGRKIRATYKNEFEEYISEFYIEDKSSFDDVLEYWENNKHRFPNMYKLSKKYLGYLCSSCSSERLFSQASGYYTSRRTRMLPSHLEHLCILNSYILNEGIEAFKNITFRSMN